MRQGHFNSFDSEEGFIFRFFSDDNVNFHDNIVPCLSRIFQIEK